MPGVDSGGRMSFGGRELLSGNVIQPNRLSLNKDR
jgi:hypothetical protein